ncbi:unnamed protein product [Closterium sp. NIES-65]|nr:unnamed protein product [Closterium sp. NIES-65]
MAPAAAIAPSPAFRLSAIASLSARFRASSPLAAIPAASSAGVQRRNAAKSVFATVGDAASPMEVRRGGPPSSPSLSSASDARRIPRGIAARAAQHSVVAATAAAGDAASLPEALLFDCDGVLVDTERDGHRVSFNQAFEEKGLGVTWDVPLYGELLKIGGGKERMTHYFNQVGWPQAAPIDPSERAAFVAGLHKSKTALFMQLVETGALPLRPGVARLIDEALAAGVRVAVCSTSNEKAVGAIVRVMLGEERAQHMRIFAGDVVPKKKPDPAIYNLAATTLSLNPARCVVIEDSHIGLTAAKAAGMTCVLHGGRGLFSDACLTPLVTHMTRTLCSCSAVSPTHLPHLPPLPLLRPSPTSYTEDEDFSAADAVFDAIGDTPADGFDLPFLASLL